MSYSSPTCSSVSFDLCVGTYSTSGQGYEEVRTLSVSVSLRYPL